MGISPPIWREIQQNYQLIGYKCKKCGYISFPRKRRICMKCRAKPLKDEEIIEPVHFSGKGTLLTYIIQYYLPKTMEPPLPAGIVQFDDGPRLWCVFTETKPEDVKVGMRVQLIPREIFESEGHWVYSWKCLPLRGED